MIERLEGKGKQLVELVREDDEAKEESWSLIKSDFVPTEQSLEEFGIVQRELIHFTFRNEYSLISGMSG